MTLVSSNRYRLGLGYMYFFPELLYRHIYAVMLFFVFLRIYMLTRDEVGLTLTRGLRFIVKEGMLSITQDNTFHSRILCNHKE